MAIGKSLEKKVAKKKKQKLSSVQSVGITNTRDVDVSETTVAVKDAKTETEDPIATLETGKLVEVKTPKDAKHDDFEEDAEIYVHTPRPQLRL